MDFDLGTVPFPRLGESSRPEGGSYEKGPSTQLDHKASLDDIVQEALKGHSSDRPVVLLFHTTQGDPSEKCVVNSARAMALLRNRDPKNGFTMALALRHAFTVLTSDIGGPVEERTQEYARLKHDRVPLFVVVSPEGKVVAKCGGNGGTVTAGQVTAMLMSASKKMGGRLGKQLKRAEEIIREMSETTKQIEALEKALNSQSGAARKGTEKRLERIRENLKDLETEEQELWATAETS